MTAMESPWMKFIHRVVEEEGVNLYTTAEAANIVGRSVKTLVRWRREDRTNAPSKEVPYKGTKFYLYTEEDIEELKELAGKLYPGRRTDLE